ncbi:MAG: tetratricopeptide repeat protein, partial [Gemmatimonadetes bacterium]|nr:tetratricopeptide repeat protein [Gemmatimonadota bacterium]
MPPHALAGDDPATCVFPTGRTLSPELASELPHEAAFALWQVLRCVELWTAEPEGVRREVFDRGYMERWERALLTGALDPEARFPLAVVVSEMAAAPAGAGRLPWACVCVADWALGRGALGAALAFTEAAARAAPQQPRYAWLAGRLLRGHGKPRDGERWLRRAHRLAVAHRDWETQARSLTSLGNLFLETGRHGDARHYHGRALRIAQRFRLREQEAMAFHDLFTVAIQDGKRAEAERYARGALAAYRSNDHRIPRLAHDVAYFWMTQGHFALALGVFLAVQPYLIEPDHGLKLLANTAHAAAGAGDRALFKKFQSEAEALISELATLDTLAAALLELACGAALVREWPTALT